MKKNKKQIAQKNINVLTEEYTTSTTSVFGMFDGTTTRQITPNKVASLLRQGQDNIVPELLAIAELMEERDPHYSSVLGTRKRAIIGVDFTVEPASQDKKDLDITDSVLEMISTIDLYSLFEDLLDAIGKGFSVVEILWEVKNGKLFPKEFLHCDPRIFTYDKTGRHIRLISGNDVYGEELLQYKFLVHFAKLKSGKSCRDGVARTALWSWMIKNYTISDWVSFCESFGVPLRIGKYGQGASDEDKKTLLRALRSLGRDSAAMMPESMQIDFNSAGDVRGNATVFSDLAKYIDEQLSKLILGQTMTADSGSSQAQATVHNDVRSDIIVSDARKLAGTINQLVSYFVELNFGSCVSVPKFKFNTDEGEDLTTLVDNVAKLIPLGLEISSDEMRNKLGLRPLEKGEVPLQSIGLVNAVNKAGCNFSTKALNKTDMLDMSEEDMIQAMVDVAGSDEPYSIPIKQALNESESFEEFQEKLPVVLNAILNSDKAEQLQQKLGESLFTSRLNGHISGDDKG